MTYTAPLVILILLHTLDGREVMINAKQVTSMYPKSNGNKLYTDDVHCLVGMTDGKFVSVQENCEAVRKMMEQTK